MGQLVGLAVELLVAEALLAPLYGDGVDVGVDLLLYLLFDQLLHAGRGAEGTLALLVELLLPLLFGRQAVLQGL